MKDNMLACAVSDAGVAGTPGDPVVMTGERTWQFAFVPSARALPPHSSDTSFNRGYDFARMHRDTFSVGYKERVTLEANNSTNWLWRRMVFTMKTLEPAQSFVSGALFQYVFGTQPEPGYVRTMYDFSVADVARQTLYREIFQGSLGVDYQDQFNAPLDTTRVRKLYDRIIPVSGGNDSGHWKMRRFWHPNKQRLIYNEKESGDHKDSGSEASHYNNGAMNGGGDLWVLDFFSAAGPADATNTLKFLPQGTYYWHER